jgi:preprotein translocase subunit SecB
VQVQALAGHFQQLALQPVNFQLFAQHLVPRLAQQQVAASCLRKTS